MDRCSISPIALVEAAYDLEVASTDWLPNLLRAGGAIFDLGEGCAGEIWTGTSAKGEPLVSQLHTENGAPDLPIHLARAAREVGSKIAGAIPPPRKPRVHTLAQARCSHPEVYEALTKYVGCKDILALSAMGPDLHGVGIQVPSANEIELSQKARQRWHMLSMHIAAGHRLRRRLGKAPRGIPVTQIPLDAEALLDSKGFSVIDPAGPGKEKGALEAIREAAIQMDRARGRLRKSETCDTLKLWEGMICGRLPIVDSFDADGRRFILALPSGPHVRDPRGLTKREYQVATYAAAGESCKLIAYRLGISRCWVSQLLHGAMRKLDVRTTAQLVFKMRTLPVETASSI